MADFHTRRASADGLAFKCKQCVNITSETWRKKNPDAHKQWYLENCEHKKNYWRNWRENNKTRLAQTYARWAKANKHKVNALVAKRNAAKFLATPGWANFDAMREIYAEATRLTAVTGIRHEVDHIYPIQGKLVCGLHCEANLQVLTKVENIRKLNRMPETLHERKANLIDSGRPSAGGP